MKQLILPETLLIAVFETISATKKSESTQIRTELQVQDETLKNALFWSEKILPKKRLALESDDNKLVKKACKIYPTVAISDEFIEHLRRVEKENKKLERIAKKQEFLAKKQFKLNNIKKILFLSQKPSQKLKPTIT